MLSGIPDNFWAVRNKKGAFAPFYFLEELLLLFLVVLLLLGLRLLLLLSLRLF
jgi:hypothetical protein